MQTRSNGDYLGLSIHLWARRMQVQIRTREEQCKRIIWIMQWFKQKIQECISTFACPINTECGEKEGFNVCFNGCEGTCNEKFKVREWSSKWMMVWLQAYHEICGPGGCRCRYGYVRDKKNVWASYSSTFSQIVNIRSASLPSFVPSTRIVRSTKSSTCLSTDVNPLVTIQIRYWSHILLKRLEIICRHVLIGVVPTDVSLLLNS